jgi:drug/metabolite transporter (DMT)-like permease
MNVDFTPFFVLGALLILSVIALIAWRKTVARTEDDTLHVLEARQPAIWQQAGVAHKLDLIDKWGKILTVVAVVYLIVFGTLLMYQQWLRASALGA